MSAKILIVDDEQAICDMLSFTLGNAGYEVAEAVNARTAELSIAEQKPDLVLLDWMMPGENGVAFSRRLRDQSATREIPIILLTARGTEDDVVTGLDAGVDDYISKPFSTRELLSRIKAVLRRAAPQAVGETLGVGDLVLDPVSHRVSVGEKELSIGPTEYKLLRFFLSHAERVYSRGDLIDQVWGQSVYIEERTVDVHIRRLREALSPFSYDRLVQTVRGVGYRFSTRS